MFRHPGYLGWFIWAPSTQLILMNPICFGLFIAMAWYFFNDRIPVCHYVQMLTFVSTRNIISFTNYLEINTLNTEIALQHGYHLSSKFGNILNISRIESNCKAINNPQLQNDFFLQIHFSS
jgi:hypothetical protein